MKRIDNNTNFPHHTRVADYYHMKLKNQAEFIVNTFYDDVSKAREILHADNPMSVMRDEVRTFIYEDSDDALLVDALVEIMAEVMLDLMKEKEIDRINEI